MRGVYRRAAAAALILIAGAAAPAADRDTGVFETHGMIMGGDVSDTGDLLWLRLFDDDVRYFVPATTPEKQQALAVLLQPAVEGGRNIAVRFEPARARVDSAAGTIDYPICSIAFEGKSVEPAGPCTASVPPPNDSAGALALARAWYLTGDPRKALDLVRSLSFEQPALRKLHLNLRADAATDVAEIEPRASRTADEALVLALEDLKALSSVGEPDADTVFGIAGALEALGAYSEAASIYDMMIERWPDESYRIAVRKGALKRLQGDYAGALAALDDLVKREGPQAGMKFHYHRGWTLSLLGRFEEAVAELTKGLKTQPDYASAYQRRACALAALGRHEKADRDAERAARLYAGLPGAASTASGRETLESIAALRAALAARLSARSRDPIKDACAGEGWIRYEKPRPRSPLLPPH